MPRTRNELTITGRANIQAADGGAGGKRFDAVAYSGEPIRQWWSQVPVVVDLDTLRISDAQSLPILYDHRDYDTECVVGRADRVQVRDYVLSASGPIFPDTDGGKRVVKLADQGHQWQVSIGANHDRIDNVKVGDKVTVNGREHQGPIDIARGVDLREISFVILGAAKNTRATVAKFLQGGSMKYETWVQSMGFNPDDLDETQSANFQRLYAEAFPDGEETEEEETAAAEEGEEKKDTVVSMGDKEDTEAVAQIRIKAAAEVRRVAAIHTLCAKFGNPTIKAKGRADEPLQSHAIEQKWTVERTELEALRMRRPQQKDIARSHDTDCDISALQGALLLRSGVKLDHKAFQSQGAIALRLPPWLRANINADVRQKAMEAAHRYSDLSAIDLCREAMRASNQDTPRGRNEMIQAAFSGGSLTNVFTTNVNAVLLSTYMEYGDTTVSWTKETEVADFRTQERPRLLKGASLTRHPRGREADHVTRSDVGESYKIGRYTGQFVVDEQDIIDDRLNTLSDMPVEMGLAAARLRPDLVYAILAANAALNADGVTLFHAGTHANTATGAALAAATLKTACTAISTQREGGVNLNLVPTHLIVPAALNFTARELVNATTIVIAGTAGTVTERGAINTLNYLGLQIVSDARLDNGVTDPSTGTSYSGDINDWFVASTGAHTIEVGYLRGTGRAPQVRSFVLDKGRWGMGWDIAMDVGAKALDYKGLYRGQG